MKPTGEMKVENEIKIELWDNVDFSKIPPRLFGSSPDNWPLIDNNPENEIKTPNLNRVIWKGRQWAVTGFGIERCDGKYYEIEKDRLLENPGYSWIEHMGEKGWVDISDFVSAFGVAVLFHLHHGGQK